MTNIKFCQWKAEKDEIIFESYATVWQSITWVTYFVVSCPSHLFCLLAPIFNRISMSLNSFPVPIIFLNSSIYFINCPFDQSAYKVCKFLHIAASCFCLTSTVFILEFNICWVTILKVDEQYTFVWCFVLRHTASSFEQIFVESVHWASTDAV